MNMTILVSALLIIAMVAFATSNPAVVYVNIFWLARIRAPLFAVILFSLALGLILMWTLTIGRQVKASRETKGLKKSIKMLEEERNLLRARNEELNSASKQEPAIGNENA